MIDRYTKAVLTVIAVALVWLCLFSQAPKWGTPAEAAGQAKSDVPDVIRAQRFELVDAQGRVRGALGMGRFGDTPGIRLYDAKGQARVVLNVHPSGDPSLTLLDDKGHLRVGLGCHHLTLYDEEGQWRAQLSLSHNDRAHLTLFDKRGQRRAALGATTLKSAATGGVEKRPESSLVLFGPAVGQGCETPEDWGLAQGEIVFSAP